MNNLQDFRLFAKDKGVSMTYFDDMLKKKPFNNLLFPTIVEERDSAMRVNEMNVFSRLIQERIVFLSGQVTSDSMDVIVAQLLYLDSVDNRDINLYINSGGGDCYSGLELVSVMDLVKSDVSTTVLGLAASMGAVIASNGEKGKRYALPYSRFMIHQPSSSFGRANFTDSKIALEEMESVRNDLYEVLAKNSGKSFDEIIQLCENGDKWFKAKDMIEHNFIDTILSKKN
jgi:ATP-dependent Clp protease protease subunit